jgi:tetratricopeptide (TPR) repeat protein
VATVPFDSFDARDAAPSSARFRLGAERFGAGDFRFFSARDTRSGADCVLRVRRGLEGAQVSRLLIHLHRERALAERIGHPAVLQFDIPMIEEGSIRQVVQPEPRRVIGGQPIGVLPLLRQLSTIADALAAAHAIGLFHGALAREQCLCSDSGDVLIAGFGGDPQGGAAARLGEDADIRAFIALASRLLAAEGGPSPRLRRLFATALLPTLLTVKGGARRDGRFDPPRALRMADLREELRESIEDTFPWPPAPTGARRIRSAPPQPDPGAQQAASASANVPASRAVTAAQPAARTSAVPPARVAVDASPVRTDVIAAARDVARPALSRAAPAAHLRRPHGRAKGFRRILLGTLIVGAIAAAGLVAGSRGVGSRTQLDPASDANGNRAGAAVRMPAVVGAGDTEATAELRPADEALPGTAAPPPAVGAEASLPTPPEGVISGLPPMAHAGTRRPGPKIAALPSAETHADELARLNLRGQAELASGDFMAATQSFAEALDFAPDNEDALEGAARARRLAGVAGLIRDAREAARRGEHARSVEGYSQALSADPANEWLAAQLAGAQLALGTDEYAVLVGRGHAAMGAGRFEAAEAAFSAAAALAPERVRRQAGDGIRRARAAMALRDATARSADQASAATSLDANPDLTRPSGP